jgi:antitoxin Phd
MADRSWSMQDAKNRFSEVAEAARRAPQTVTRHGKPAVVGWTCWSTSLGATSNAQAPSFADLLLAVPQHDGEFLRRDARSRSLMFLIDTVTPSELRSVSAIRRSSRGSNGGERPICSSRHQHRRNERGNARQRPDPSFASAPTEWLDRFQVENPHGWRAMDRHRGPVELAILNVHKSSRGAGRGRAVLRLLFQLFSKASEGITGSGPPKPARVLRPSADIQMRLLSSILARNDITHGSYGFPNGAVNQGKFDYLFDDKSLCPNFLAVIANHEKHSPKNIKLRHLSDGTKLSLNCERRRGAFDCGHDPHSRIS